MRGEPFGTRRTSKSPVLQTLPSPNRPPNFALTLLFFAVFFFLLAVLDLPARLQCSPVDIDPILSPNADLIACFASREACWYALPALPSIDSTASPVPQSALLLSTTVLIDARFVLILITLSLILDPTVSCV